MAETKKNIMTFAGLRALEDELFDLKVYKRKEVAQKIKEAREQGDLSENAEYDAARDEQRDNEAKIEELENLIHGDAAHLFEGFFGERADMRRKEHIRQGGEGHG